MRTPTRVLLGLGAATVVAAGGTAFTNSNTFDPHIASDRLGYGTTSVTGVTTSNIVYNRLNTTTMQSIVFHIDRDVRTGHSSVLRLTGGVTAAENVTCTAAWDSVASTGTLTCPTSRPVADVITLELNVTPI